MAPDSYTRTRPARALTDEGQATFSAEQLIGRVEERGGRWSRQTLLDLLLREPGAPGGYPNRVRHGMYRLRRPDEDRANPTAAAGAVLVALRTLADADRKHVTVREIEEVLAAAGAPYGSRSVYAGLRALRRADPPAVVRVPGDRYALGRDAPSA